MTIAIGCVDIGNRVVFWHCKTASAAIYGSNVREVQLADAEAELRELMKHLTADGSRKVMSPMETHIDVKKIQWLGASDLERLG